MELRFMQRALELAQKGLGFTSPNPAVGAVIVKGGVVIAEGYHKKAGEDHAEIVAIKHVMRKSGVKSVDLDPALFQNAVLYVTLEPCSHNGKTPPCAKAIVAAGFKKVCVGMKDLSAKVNGKGIKFLKDNGVEVEVLNSGILHEEIRRINQPFIKTSTVGLPYVLMKAGMSLDGKIATKSGDSKWITSEASRRDARLLRSMFDAVLVGFGTVLNDNCELAAHGKYRAKNLLRVIIDRKLSLPLNKKVFRDKNVFVACADLAPKSMQQRFQKAGIPFQSFGRNEISLKKLLQYLAKMGVQSLFVEGGSSVNGTFFDQSRKEKTLLDAVVFYQAPILIGGVDSKSVIGGEGVGKLSFCPTLKNVNMKILDTDVRISGELMFY